MILIPKPMRYPDYSMSSSPFFRIVSMDSWVRLSHGADLVPYRERVAPPRVYAPGHYDPPTLGTWSGDVDKHAHYRDDALPEGSLICPF